MGVERSGSQGMPMHEWWKQMGIWPGLRAGDEQGWGAYLVAPCQPPAAWLGDQKVRGFPQTASLGGKCISPGLSAHSCLNHSAGRH